jgi:hypothetical protein
MIQLVIVMEFEADLILSGVETYQIELRNEFDFIGEDCNRFYIKSNFPWINTFCVIEFEVILQLLN